MRMSTPGETPEIKTTPNSWVTVPTRFEIIEGCAYSGNFSHEPSSLSSE